MHIVSVEIAIFARESGVMFYNVHRIIDVEIQIIISIWNFLRNRLQPICKAP